MIYPRPKYRLQSIVVDDLGGQPFVLWRNNALHQFVWGWVDAARHKEPLLPSTRFEVEPDGR